MTDSEENKKQIARLQALTQGADSSPDEHIEFRLDELARDNRQLKRKIFDLYTIFEISRNINAVLDYRSLMESFIFTCLGQVGAQRGALYVKPGIDADHFRLADAKGSGRLPTEEIVIRDDTPMMGYLKRLNRPILVKELSADLLDDQSRDILGCFEGGLLVPLIYKTRLAGLFLLADKLSGRSFAPDEIEFLSALGSQISVAIENARLYEAERSANERLLSTQQQLVQTERLATLGEMSAKIAHEVNNPLGIIKNYLLLLKRTASDGKQVKEYADVVGHEIDRIAKIVDELRQFQRPVRTPVDPIDIRYVLDDTLTLMERQLTADGVILVRQFQDGPALIRGHADSFKQVFINIIVNAASAMEEGGTLTIELARKGDKVQIDFEDTGPGIPGDIVDRIFEPFFSTKGEGGTGLGLSICYGIIKSHRGSITFRNGDKGGCFTILLPLTKE